MAPRLKLTSLLFKRPCFSCVNDIVLILSSRNLHKKSGEAFMKMWSTQASLSYKGQVTMHTTGNGRLRFQAPLSSLLNKVPWLRLVTCLLHFADSRKQKTEGRETMIKSLSPLNSFTDPGRKWKLNITSRENVYLSKTRLKKGTFLGTEWNEKA